MPYTTVVEKMQERLSTVPGLTHWQNGEPTAVQDGVIAYTIFAGFRRQQVAQLISNVYTVLLCVCVKLQDAAAAEEAIAPFVNRIPAAFDPSVPAQATLDANVNITNIPLARSGEVDGFVNIGGALCRRIAFDIEITEKKPYGSGI